MTQVHFIRLPELRRMLGGISTMTVNRWEAKGWLPRRVHLGPNTVAWPAHEIEAFAARLMAERQNGGGKNRPTDGMVDGAGEGKHP